MYLDRKPVLRAAIFGYSGVLPFVFHASVGTAICLAVAIICCIVINWILENMWFSGPRKWPWLTLMAARFVIYGLPFVSAYFIYMQHGILFWGNADLVFTKMSAALCAIMLLVIVLPNIFISDIQSDAGFGKHPFCERKKKRETSQSKIEE